MKKSILFVSDIHLSPTDLLTSDAFADFLSGPATECIALYILGDLFEYWIGDDQMEDAFYALHAQRIALLSSLNIPVYLIVGNRDFLIGQRFIAAAKIHLLTDPCLIKINHREVLLSHGDIWCTNDISYQRYRSIVRHPITQWVWLHLPRSWRERQTKRLRSQLTKNVGKKMDFQIDVHPLSVDIAMQETGADTVIHGHTHRPAKHIHVKGIRWVLPDWKNGCGGWLSFNEMDDFKLCTISNDTSL